MERYHCSKNAVLSTQENIKPKFNPELFLTLKVSLRTLVLKQNYWFQEAFPDMYQEKNE